MTYILKDKDKNILSYSETSFILDPASGESLEYIDQHIAEYARRLVLSHGGVSCFCLSVQAQQGGPDVQVDVSTTLGVSVIELDINGTAEVVELEDAKGKLLLSTANPGIFIITPADRKTFCAAGCGSLVVEVVANA